MDLLDVKKELETEYGLSVYTILNMIDTEFIHTESQGLKYYVYFNDYSYIIKLYDDNDYCIIACDKYIFTLHGLAYIIGDKLVIINNNYNIVFNQSITGIKSIFNINNLLIACETDTETIFINEYTGKIELKLNYKCARLYTDIRNWSTIKTNTVYIDTCKNLTVISKSCAEDNIILLVSLNISNLYKTDYETKPCSYDFKFIHSDTDYYIRGDSIYTLDELLEHLGIQIVETILKDDKIDRYTVKSKDGLIGEMSNDFIHIKLGNKHIKSYIMTLDD